MADDQDKSCRSTGPDADGFIRLHRAETNGAFAIINLGCCDQAELMEAMASYLAERDYGERPEDWPGAAD